ncbi:MAG: hypothetical protein JNK77_01490 [Saprospiraceae bacterium]|nr:hypothetical protein [Saprospiraceae bacterium]
MSFIRTLALTILLGLLLQLVLPWWGIALAGAIAGAIGTRNLLSAFLAGLLGAALLWGGYAAYLNDLNQGLLAEKMGILLKGVGANGMLILTAIVGGIYGGLGALLGCWARRLLRPGKA